MAPIHSIDVPTLCFDAAVPTDRIGHVWGAPCAVSLGARLSTHNRVVFVHIRQVATWVLLIRWQWQSG
jgi:hypothetical protein